MRPLVSWMTRVDDAILEALDETGWAAPPKVIYANIGDVSYSQVKRRVKVLEKTGLVYKDAERADYYAISEIGEQYLAGEIDREDLEVRGGDEDEDEGGDGPAVE